MRAQREIVELRLAVWREVERYEPELGAKQALLKWTEREASEWLCRDLAQGEAPLPDGRKSSWITLVEG